MARKAIDTSAALERILSAYGFKQQKELAEHLGIHGNNVSSWLARNSIPSSVFLECALDTGVDVHWLVYGVFANASFPEVKTDFQGAKLHDTVLSNGGRTVVERILNAYGFSTQKQLCDLLCISSGTVSTWIRRRFFPGDVVITCALDTGIPLEWLALGRMPQEAIPHEAPTGLPKIRLDSGRIENAGYINFPFTHMNINAQAPVYLDGYTRSWLVDIDKKNLDNSMWVIGIDSVYDIYHVSVLPGGKIKMKNNKIEMECLAREVCPYGKVVLSILIEE